MLKMMGGDAEKIMRAAGGDMSALPAIGAKNAKVQR